MVYRENDCDPSALRGRTIAVIGYGSQGQAQALNLKESGFKVVVGLYAGSASWKRAEAAGLTVMTAAEAAKAADFIVFLASDEAQPRIYAESVAPALRGGGKALAFAHGFNVLYGQIVPPDDVDVVLVSPTAPGESLRSAFLEGRGVPCLAAVGRDATGNAKALALAYAAGIGCARAGILETSFREETETSLFASRAVVAGGAALMKAGVETLAEAGYGPEPAFLECVRQMRRIVEMVDSGGFQRMRSVLGAAAAFGSLEAEERVVTGETRAEMGRILKEIRRGEYAREWILENQAGRPSLGALRRLEAESKAERAGAALRSALPPAGEHKEN